AGARWGDGRIVVKLRPIDFRQLETVLGDGDQIKRGVEPDGEDAAEVGDEMAVVGVGGDTLEPELEVQLAGVLAGLDVPDELPEVAHDVVALPGLIPVVRRRVLEEAQSALELGVVLNALDNRDGLLLVEWDRIQAGAAEGGGGGEDGRRLGGMQIGLHGGED